LSEDNMALSQREQDLIDTICDNLMIRGLCFEEDEGMVKAELTIFMKQAKYICYDQISDLILNHALQFKAFALDKETVA